jgi:hypothetical protein
MRPTGPAASLDVAGGIAGGLAHSVCASPARHPCVFGTTFPVTPMIVELPIQKAFMGPSSLLVISGNQIA